MAENDHLEGRVSSLDREVVSLGRTVVSVRSTLENQEARQTRMEHSLEKLVEMQTREKPPIPIFAAAATLVAVLTMFAGFMQLRLDPIQTNALRVYEKLERHDLLLAERGAIIASSLQNLSDLDNAFTHLDAQHHATQERVQEVEKGVSELKKAESIIDSKNTSAELIRAIRETR